MTRPSPSAKDIQALDAWLGDIEKTIEAEQSLPVDPGLSFLKSEALIFTLIDRIDALPDPEGEEMSTAQSACFLAFDICVAQLQTAAEHHNKHAQKRLDELMLYLAQIFNESKHTLQFWTPLLNAFYEANIELLPALQSAYLNVVEREEQWLEGTLPDPAESMQTILAELKNMSDYDIAEHFFAQSHAMPLDFYADFVLDLCSVPEGQDIALLFLMHPKEPVRAMTLSIINQMMASMRLHPRSLLRLQMLSRWYPLEAVKLFERWIKQQRKQGVIFPPHLKATGKLKYQATEIDGSGTQGIFIHHVNKAGHTIAGLLINAELGFKSVWLTPPLSQEEAAEYGREAVDERVTIKTVPEAYLITTINHFIAHSQANHTLPPLRLLELQEMIGIQFFPEAISTEDKLQQLGIQIQPFTPAIVDARLALTRQWINKSALVQSWFEESPEVDRIVNKHCSFVQDAKVCELAQACQDVIHERFETQREYWGFFFLWTALWAKAWGRRNSQFWKDCFFIAYALSTGKPMDEIPVLREMARLSVINSLETMGERRTHLNLS